MASQIDAGTVWINEHLIIFCETPWGGCKQSGWGKDLSTMALDEYTHTKHVYIDLTGEAVKPWYMNSGRDSSVSEPSCTSVTGAGPRRRRSSSTTRGLTTTRARSNLPALRTRRR